MTADFDLGEVRAAKYFIYARKSTDDSQKQVKSIEDQVNECKQLADRLGLNVVEVITESISAKQPFQRPQFKRMVEEIKKGNVKGLIAWHPDRLARNMLEGGQIIQLIDDGKLMDLNFVSFTFNNDAEGKLMLGMVFAMSKHYSDKLSRDVKRGLSKRLREGKSAGQYKPGYFRDPETGFYHPDETHFDTIKIAWDMRLRGETEIDIVKKVNALGYQRTYKSKRKPSKMTKQKLNDIFKDPIYYGVLRQSDIEIELDEFYEFQPMVTQTDFLSVQKSRKNYIKQQVKHEFPFRGFVLCAECHENRIAAPSKGKNDVYLYYRCDTQGCSQKGKSVRARVIIDAIYEILMTSFDSQSIDREQLEKDMKLVHRIDFANIQTQIRSLNGQKQYYEKQLDDLLENRLSLQLDEKENAVYLKKRRHLEREIGDIESELKGLKAAKHVSVDSLNETLNTLKTLSESFKLCSAEIKDKIAKTVFLNTYVQSNKKPLFKAKAPFDEMIKHPLVMNGAQERT